jgi:hypothetical protein
MSEIYRRLASHFRKTYFFAVVLAAVFSTALIVGNATVFGAAPSPDAALSTVSSVGTLVAIPPSADSLLQRAVRNGEATGAQRLLGMRGDRAFYRIGNGTRPDCFAVGPAAPAAYHFGRIRCSNFPSAETPVLPLVLFRGEPGTKPRIWRCEGFAADGVVSIALQDAAGNVLARTAVEDNMFRFDPIPEGSSVLVGLDSADKVVDSYRLG